MDGAIRKTFDIEVFLSTVGIGRNIVRVAPRQTFFSQGSPADCVYYLQTGRAKLTVVSRRGKEATVTLLAVGDFFGEECMAAAGTLRTATAEAITLCAVLRITVLVDARADGVHVSYDRMVSLLAPYGNPDALKVARDLDAKVEHLLHQAAV